MIYQFLGISRQHYDKTQAQQIRIQADSETHARAVLGRDFVLVLLGRLPDSAANDRTLTAGALTAKNKVVSISNVKATHLDTTNDNSGNRTRQLSGIFLSKIPQTGLLHPFNTELAIRLRGRNKASNRTNKPRRLLSVVDCLIAPIMGGNSLTKITGNPIMKTHTNTATNPPIVLSADVKGVIYA